ncbi:MAG: hypothetical protein ACRYG8_24375 [Janthinobacterium lividum]
MSIVPYLARVIVARAAVVMRRGREVVVTVVVVAMMVGERVGAHRCQGQDRYRKE